MWWLNKNITKEQLELGGSFMNTPNYGDHIIFNIKGEDITYIVGYDHLSISTADYTQNPLIFNKLDLDPIKFCKKYYRYKPLGGFWPHCKNGDFEALRRVIVALQDECYRFNKKN